MSSLSKFFDEQIRHRTCNELAHPGSCLNHGVISISKFMLSNAKHYIPLCFISVGLKMHNLNSDILKKALKSYVEDVLCGTLVGYSIKVMICIFRNILGEYRHYTFAFWPSFIGAMTIFLMPKHTQRIHIMSLNQSTLESILMRRKNVLSKFIADSKMMQTLLFMCCSGLILHAHQNNLYRGFWLLKSNPKISQEIIENEHYETPDHPICNLHSNVSCSQYLIKGIRNYLAIGVFLDLVKAIFNKNEKGMLAKLRVMKLRSTALLASYVSMYRFFNCYFNRLSPQTCECNHMLASFLSGSSYSFLPKLSLFSFGIITSVQILWNIYERQQNVLEKEDKQHKHWKYTKFIPFGQLSYALAIAHSVHVYVLRNRNVSSLSAMIINGSTNFYARNITKRLEQLNGFVP